MVYFSNIIYQLNEIIQRNRNIDELTYIESLTAKIQIIDILYHIDENYPPNFDDSKFFAFFCKLTEREVLVDHQENEYEIYNISSNIKSRQSGQHAQSLEQCFEDVYYSFNFKCDMFFYFCLSKSKLENTTRRYENFSQWYRRFYEAEKKIYKKILLDTEILRKYE